MPEIRANNVPEELMRRFDIERAKRGRMSIRDAVIQAIELWITGGEVAKSPGARVFAHEHELLDALLSSEPEMAEQIKGVLNTFARALSSSRGGRAKKAG